MSTLDYYSLDRSVPCTVELYSYYLGRLLGRLRWHLACHYVAWFRGATEAACFDATADHHLSQAQSVCLVIQRHCQLAPPGIVSLEDAEDAAKQIRHLVDHITDPYSGEPEYCLLDNYRLKLGLPPGISDIADSENNVSQDMPQAARFGMDAVSGMEGSLAAIRGLIPPTYREWLLLGETIEEVICKGQESLAETSEQSATNLKQRGQDRLLKIAALIQRLSLVVSEASQRYLMLGHAQDEVTPPDPLQNLLRELDEAIAAYESQPTTPEGGEGEESLDPRPQEIIELTRLIQIDLQACSINVDGETAEFPANKAYQLQWIQRLLEERMKRDGDGRVQLGTLKKIGPKGRNVSREMTTQVIRLIPKLRDLIDRSHGGYLLTLWPNAKLAIASKHKRPVRR